MSKQIEHIDAYNHYLNMGLNEGIPVFLDFYATWCKPCKHISPIFESMAEQFYTKKKGIFMKIDTDKFKDLVTKYTITNLPTFITLVDEKVVDRVIGANKEGLEKMVLKYVIPQKEEELQFTDDF